MAKGFRVTKVHAGTVKLEQADGWNATILVQDYQTKREVRAVISVWDIAQLARQAHEHLDRIQTAVNVARKRLKAEP